jgi:small subunit ribosomal protein S17
MSDTQDTAAVETAVAAPAVRPNPRKVKEGIVASTSMQKTIVVTVTDKVRHDRYSKTIQRTVRLHVHDETNDAKVGDRVRVQETRPLSKTKRWRLVEILERAR